MPVRCRWLALVLLPGLAGVFAVRAHAVESPLCTVRTEAPTVASHPAGTITTPDPISHPRRHVAHIASAAFGRTIDVNVLVPPVDQHGTPSVLYLLHGHGGNAGNWLGQADSSGTSLEERLDALRATHQLAKEPIIVMPPGGYDGWYSDWYGVDADGHNGTDANAAPAWESFHTGELVAFIDEHYKHTHNLIAGLSMGGYGAMIYAERHPALFTAVGSFSGALDTQLYGVEPLVQPIAQNAPDRQQPDNCIWGDAVLQHDIWTEHNPQQQVRALGTTMPVYVSSGDGCAPSPANVAVVTPADCTAPANLPSKGGAMFTEWGVRQQTVSFVDALRTVRPDLTHTKVDLYANGDHSWTFWLAKLNDYLAWAHDEGAI